MSEYREFTVTKEAWEHQYARAEKAEQENAELRATVERVNALAGWWTRLAEQGPGTYSEIRKRHAAELRAELDTAPIPPAQDDPR